MRLLIPGVLVAVAVAVVGLIPTEVEEPVPSKSWAMAGAGKDAPLALIDAGQDGADYEAYLARYPSLDPSGEPEVDLSDVSDEVLTRVVERTCGTCHNDALETGNLSLEGFDVAAAAQDAQRAEAVINMLRMEMMPPRGIPRPGGDTLMAVARTLEEKLDAASAQQPNPGFRSFQRLNRAEYERAIEDLLGLQVDASEWLPMDNILAGFDNLADGQTLTPSLLEAYLTAAGTISRRAVGNPETGYVESTYRQPQSASQHQWDRIEGAPMGTRGGMVVTHDFPADGKYVLNVETRASRGAEFEDIDVSIDGEQVALLQFEDPMAGSNRGGGYPLATEPIYVEAGQRKVSVTFVRQTEGPYEDLLRPHAWSLAGEGEASSYGVTNLPHIWDVVIAGPQEPAGVSDNPTRERIFTCRPESEEEARPCAESILSRLAEDAYRRPVGDEDLAGLMAFYDEGYEDGGFENGVRLALQAILASPNFIFRMEREPAGLASGEAYPVADLDLASRLSFFLWGRAPDRELLEVASEGRLSDPQVLEEQTLRMLDDPRAEALASRFAAQWLRLPDMDNIQPDPYWYPDFSVNLRDDLRKETELLFEHVLREDRSVLELFEADYTFLNERVARHYGISGVSGDDFRKVDYPEGMQRQGLLGHGSILLLTSVGNRTSPVLRGVWVMEVLLGTPPPPPPPDVPELEDAGDVADGEILTTREQLAIHRDNPACSSCHEMIDPIGVALDNYDVLGQWRTRESGVPVTSTDVAWDGTEVNGPVELAGLLLSRPAPLVRNFVEYMMAYATGRPMEYFDQPAIRQVVRDAEDYDYALSSIVLGIVQSEPFQMRTVGEVAADDEADADDERR